MLPTDIISKNTLLNNGISGYTLAPIGVIRSPYKEKFAIPRQPGLVNADGTLHLLPPYNQPEAIRGLAGFSHIWLIFIFHQTQSQRWHTTVRPPRLGGNARIGVFASRSPFRPNPIGLSLLPLHGIRYQKKQLILQLGDIDLLDGTPVLDIKPYLPYAEALPEALAGYAQQPPTASMSVFFSDDVEQQLASLQPHYPELRSFLCQVLAQDPRPAYRRNEAAGQCYAAWLADFNVRWRISERGAEVFALQPR